MSASTASVDFSSPVGSRPTAALESAKRGRGRPKGSGNLVHKHEGKTISASLYNELYFRPSGRRRWPNNPEKEREVMEKWENDEKAKKAAKAAKKGNKTPAAAPAAPNQTPAA